MYTAIVFLVLRSVRRGHTKQAVVEGVVPPSLLCTASCPINRAREKDNLQLSAQQETQEQLLRAQERL